MTRASAPPARRQIGGRPLVRVVVEVTADPTCSEDDLRRVGDVLAEGLGHSVDAFLAVNGVMDAAGVNRRHIRVEPAPVSVNVDEALALLMAVYDRTFPTAPPFSRGLREHEHRYALVALEEAGLRVSRA